MSFNRRLFVLAATLLVTACGFTPVYAPGGTGAALQNQILVDEPQDRNAYWFTQRFEERLGRAGDAKYSLGYKIFIVEQGIAVDPQGYIERYDLLGRTDYEVRDISTEEVLASGQVESFTGYSASGTTVASLAAERDARERLMIILADQVIVRLISTFEPPS